MQMKEDGQAGGKGGGGDVWWQMFCSSLDAIILAAADGTILDVNVEACRLFAMTAEEIRRVGRDELIDPADDRLASFIAEQTCTGRVRGELRMKRGDGSLFPAAVASAVFRDGNGRELTCVVIRDMTEQRRLEEELRQNERRYRALYEKTPAMVHSSDRSGRLIAVSDCWLDSLGYRREEVIGHSPLEFMTEESRRHAEKVALPAFFCSGEARNVPLQMVKKSGEVLDLLLSATAERDEAGEISRTLCVLVDVTERLRVEDALAESERKFRALNMNLASRATELEDANGELDAFNHTVSHDLRSPLTLISGYIQLMQEIYGDRLDEQGKDFLREIANAARRMGRLIDTLLKFSTMAHQEMKRVRVDLSAIVVEVAAELQLSAPQRQGRFIIPKRIKASGDPLLLRIVLANLLANAWKYTARRDSFLIEFGTTSHNGQTAYFVRDNGVGFAMEEVGLLFVPFKRLHREGDYEGCGIGLATVQRIVRRHGGRVWAEGEVDNGATFWFTLGEQ